MKKSKPLENADICAFEFTKEMLCGDLNAGFDGFDRQMFHPTRGLMCIEFLRCNEEQGENGITPHTSHPNNYWEYGYRKFLNQWKLYKTYDCKKEYWLVNYARENEKHSKEIRLMKVKNFDINNGLKTINYNITRKQFSKWLRKLNRECYEANN